jgi:hypothetical protein
MRRFLRHSTEIPIDIAILPGCATCRSHLSNLSEGGLCCCWHQAIEPDTPVEIRIPANPPVYQGEGVVVWCRPNEDSFDLGICFAGENDAFKSRMVQQVCLIECYRKQVLAHEGRALSPDEAANEWIGKYAEQFADS